MAKNDIVLLDGILEDLENATGVHDRGRLFDMFASTHLMKQFELSPDEIATGITDGCNDGGIDMFYTFVNGTLIDDEDVALPRTSCEIEAVLITCKHANEFVQDPINVMYPSIDELFDLSKQDGQLCGVYNDEIRKQRNIFLDVYKKTAFAQSSISFKVIYASRGDTDNVTDNVRARAHQIEECLSQSFSESRVVFEFVGAAELLSLYRKRPKFDLSLPVESYATREKNNFVVLSKLSDYYHFITDEKGKIRRYLFDSNVRDFLGNNVVNNAITQTLQNINSIDFWCLNNGVTILASNAFATGSEIKIENVQIVNGLQTSFSIYNYFVSNQETLMEDKRTLVVKIISQSDKEARDSIIRSTNNQSAIQLSSLFATDKIQRDIEEYMFKCGYFYERRKNCFEGQAIDYSKLFDIVSLAKGYLTLINKLPETALSFKQKHLANVQIYNEIFNENVSLNVWPQIANVLWAVEHTYRTRCNGLVEHSEGVYTKYRRVVEYLSVARVLGKLDYREDEFAQMSQERLTEDIIEEVWGFVVNIYDKKMMKRRGCILALCVKSAERWNLSGIQHLLGERHHLMRSRKGYEEIPMEYRKYLPADKKKLIGYKND